MLITVSIVLQALLLALALTVVILRCWARLRFERATLTIAEYFAWLGWLFSLGWFICSTVALQILIKHPAVGEELVVDNVAYLKTVFIAEYFFDIGIYWPKLSIVAFYWFLIPHVLQTLRKALHVSTAYLVCCLIAAFLVVTLITTPISNNWSIENQLESAWNSYTVFVVQWCLNFSTDLLLSLARFIAYNVTDFGLDDASGNTLCTAEMTTAVTVVCLPGLKKFITRSKTPTNTSDGGNVSQYGSKQLSSNHAMKSRSIPQAYAEWGIRDDEIELVTNANKSYPPSTDTPDGRDATV
ncbi:hypothetical protein FSARC_9965 [Fusarium sarcochroum]|uniref:Rhodopsin domain-containing protein n=1 Tax=Fusarium sarcochroum TaxID=1208366 RepID=A0A8H4X5N0_9HYPO|nr:hypothetical protein FSARC_9965 [Fusarium sarcochroum]